MTTLYDAIVVGGGVNGCGVARDLAMRGLEVLLVEKGDFSMGTSWASSGMIHGGLRYLMSDVHTTYKSCKDAGYIRSIAPHLTFRIPFLMPVLDDEGLKGRVNLEGADALFELYDRFQPYKGGKAHIRFSPEEVARIEPLIAKNLVGAVITDEWGIDVPRLCVLNALDAKRHGATLASWTRVTELIREGGSIAGIRTLDELTGEAGEARARLVVNCGGPWAPELARMAGARIRLRPAKGVHLILDRRISNNGIIAQALDGRQVFVIPHENVSMIGTTDDDFFGDPDDIPILEDEVKYLLEAMERVIPGIRNARVIKAIAGIRPTLFERAKYEDDLTRDHRVYDHEALDGVRGFVSLAGGKLAAYRVMAEETADLVCRKLGCKNSCATHLQPLPGGEEIPDAEELAIRYGQDPYAVSRLIFRQGARAMQVLDMMREKPETGVYVCSCDPVTEAELRFAIRNEAVRRPIDLISRCRIGEGPCQGHGCLTRAAEIFGEERRLSSSEIRREALWMMREKWRWRKEILGGAQLVQEELTRMVHRSLLEREEGR